MCDLDLAHGPNCGADLKIIAATLEQPVIGKTPRTGRYTPGRHRAQLPPVKRCKRVDDSDSPLFRRRARLLESATPEGLRDRWMRAGGRG